MNRAPSSAPLTRAGFVLGMGMGGFLDGIVFHQILQLHAMLSARIPNTDLVGAKINMFWDGMFHLAVWMMTATGVCMLWHAGARAPVRWCGPTFIGALLLGWGLFNFIEGLIDHHILHLHHVYEPAGLSAWDYAFLGSGVLLILMGLKLIRYARREHALPSGSNDAQK